MVFTSGNVKISPTKLLTRRSVGWLWVFSHCFSPFRWPQNSLECIFDFHYSLWTWSAQLSSRRLSWLISTFLQAVCGTPGFCKAPGDDPDCNKQFINQVKLNYFTPENNSEEVLRAIKSNGPNTHFKWMCIYSETTFPCSGFFNSTN